MSVEDVAKLPKKMRSLEDIIQRLEREAKIEICDAMVLIADWRKKKEALMNREMNTAYEALVERCAKIYCISLAEDDYPDAVRAVERAWMLDRDDPAREAFCEIARAVLAEVFRTLETVTPEMLEAASMMPSTQMIAKAVWMAMLPASAIAPPKAS